MVQLSLASTRARFGSVVAAAALTVALAACGSSSPADDSPATTVAAATTVAPTTTAAATTTTAAARKDTTLAAIAKMTDCDTIATVKRVSQTELDGAKDDAGKKLYGDRVAATQARLDELKCPAA